MLITLLSFAAVAGIIITIHEFGHFMAARLTGMRVKKFSIGFPPRLFTKKIGETEFSLSWIPLGGYVQIAGMVDESMEGEGITGAPDEFMSKNPFQKIFVLSAGVLMNYITAFVLIAGLTLFVGIGELDKSYIGEVSENMPAQTAGVKNGDKIISVNGSETSTWDDVVKTISNAGDTIQLSLLRSETNETLNFSIPTQSIDNGKGGQRHVIGIAPKLVFRPAGFGDVISQGWEFCYASTAGILGFLKEMISGNGSLSQLSGPLGVAKMSGESARQGLSAFLFFIAYVSVSIGFLNILPFPVLDGGHIVYVIIEAIIRRPISTKIKLGIQQVGMGLLLLLVILVSYHDVMRIFGN